MEERSCLDPACRFKSASRTRDLPAMRCGKGTLLGLLVFSACPGFTRAEPAALVALTGRAAAQSANRKYNFTNDIIPLLSKFGCNSSACHGKAEGQNGFKLSVFGSDPASDYAALTK